MTVRALELAKQARKLPAIERERLAERLLAPLARRRLTKVDEAWVAEAERRYRAWKRGRSKAVPSARAIAAIREELDR
jgi:putative addiction module component (TIGR02574 family)